MRTLQTETIIAANPQTVWAVMDDLELYGEWNALVPELCGPILVDRVVTGQMKIEGGPDIDLAPTITRIVGARELRWLTTIPGEKGFTAEHCFTLQPLSDGRTKLLHEEIFDGPGSEALWPLFDHAGRAAYERFNMALSERAEAQQRAKVVIHPVIDQPISMHGEPVADLNIHCRCDASPVEIQILTPIQHNHLCGCSKCWKPEGALFAQTAVSSKDGLVIGGDRDKLVVVDPTQSIVRHACSECGVHLFGLVEDPLHHFYGLIFVHPELAVDRGTVPLEFAGFVSSIIEAGAMPEQMAAVRARIAKLGLPAFDAFSPEIMDLIAWHRVKVRQNPNPVA
jgi:S-(hydroxymethyl)glutathione synthase